MLLLVRRIEGLGRQDSNLRMPESKSGALTNLATPHPEYTRRKRRTVKPLLTCTVPREPAQRRASPLANAHVRIGCSDSERTT